MSKVLIVDDEGNLGSLLTGLIKLEGFAVTGVGNFKAALKAISKEEQDVILATLNYLTQMELTSFKRLR